jgi:hypothetical protein
VAAVQRRAGEREGPHFQDLLADLCAAIPEPAPKSAKGGRPAARLGDATFSAVLKVYALMSARRW